MLRNYCFLTILAVTACATSAQTNPSASASPGPSVQTRDSAPFNLAEYGVSFQADARLIIVMAALDAAGFDPTPASREPSAFRALLRRDQANLDASLRERLTTYYQRHKLPAPATSADQAARYVSLAYALGPPPSLAAPEHFDELPAGVLEVLDFGPMVREFFKQSGIEGRLPAYVRAAQAESDRLRQPAAEMVRAVLSYLHTRPILLTNERVRVKSPDNKKNAQTTYTFRQHERRFFIVPDLMAAPGTVNFRVIADDYYAIVPEGTDLSSSELRRAYVQFVIDPLVLKFNKEIAARREQVKQLIDARTKAGGESSTDVFTVVSRSLVAAADARFEESQRLAQLSDLQRLRLQQARNDAARVAIAKESGGARAAISDETMTRLAEDYEKGALLDFYFADQFREVEVSGFDVASFLGDMVASFDPAREGKRLADTTDARARALAARKAHPAYSMWLIDPGAEGRDAADTSRSSALTRSLREIETLLQTRNYEQAETRLKALLQENPGDARLLFTLGQTASLWARDTTDDDLQSQRLNRALANYRLATQAAAPETDKALLSRAHEAMGRILAFLERNDEAMKEFEAAIKLGEVTGGAYRDAMEGKRKLAQP